MAQFVFSAKVVRVRDGDTIIVDPYIYRDLIYLVVRFKDVFAPEVGESGYQSATDAANEMFPPGCEVELTNTRSHWTYDRLEARVDRT